MQIAVGFLIALAVGITGIGGGSFTVPALILLVGLAPAEAVGTAFVFAGVLRLIAAPFYLFGRHVHGRYLWLMLQGAVPGLLIGTIFLRWMNADGKNPLIVILLGLILAASSTISFAPRVQYPQFARKNSQWLPWLALPIGVEAGFSSAGAGALGTVLLLNYSEMPPPQVVGTDILFGLVLAVIGSAFHWKFGAINSPVLLQFLAGGIPGVLVGCLLARRVPARKLKSVVALVAIVAGLQLVWSGAHSLTARHSSVASGISSGRPGSGSTAAFPAAATAVAPAAPASAPN
ncbi:MAG: sulfite exporter TauE/SafE family protein [Candidatus Acidiferrales bacterium]